MAKTLFNGNGNGNIMKYLTSCQQVTGNVTLEDSANTFVNYQSNGSGNYKVTSTSKAGEVEPPTV